MSSFKKLAVTSVKWTTYKTFIIAGISILSQLILAKFIPPKEFANLSAILIVLGFAQIFQNLGITQSIIQKEKIDKEEMSSLFFLSTFLSIIIGLIVFFLSDFIADFYSLPNLGYYIKLIAISICLSGPSNIYRSVLEKKLLFKEMSIIEIVSHIILLLLTTVLLFNNLGVLSVVYANIFSAIYTYTAMTILYHKKAHIGIRFYFRGSKITPFLKFGMFVSIKDIITYSSHRMDEVVIGYFLKPEILGMYFFGKRLIETLRALMTKSFSKVLFPIFSNLNNDKPKLLSVYKKITSYISIVAFPVFAGIAITAHLFVPLIFGAKWNDSVLVFQVFSVLMMFMVLTANISTSLLYALNKPAIVLYIDVITNIFYFLFLFLFAKNGIVYILIIYSVYILIKTIVLQYVTNYSLNHSFRYYLKIIKMNAIITLIMVSAVLLFQFITKGFLSDFLLLTGSVLIGSGAFLSALLLLNKNLIKEIIFTLKFDRI